jgi:hypothetical protein
MMPLHETYLILPNLAVGSDPRVDEEFQELRALKITAILSLQTDEDRTDGGIEDERTAADKAGLVFCSVPLKISIAPNFSRPCQTVWLPSNACSSRVTMYTSIAQPA